ncbi:hypothetical protein PHJA_000016500 [Phtheirospermum japonicum]|uniref:Uncharacterized protein n=1 Tax=Phtheirospermum japonicum TaxID=374723 RepID=A0A830B0K2_9LAMI|nr:hypothetical protein PHJA_000016500 [Phtheirospermum japonicum]
MFCCVRTRGRKERDFDDHRAVANSKTPGAQPSPPPPVKPVTSGYDEKSGKSGGDGLKDGNMVVLAGAGAVVGATAATAVVVAVGDNDGDASQGCCCGGGGGGAGGANALQPHPPPVSPPVAVSSGGNGLKDGNMVGSRCRCGCGGWGQQ